MKGINSHRFEKQVHLNLKTPDALGKDVQAVLYCGANILLRGMFVILKKAGGV